jgi:hypothetical protein
MTNGELKELVHLLMMCGIMDKTALESGNVTNEEWLRMKSLIAKYQSEKTESESQEDLISRNALKKAFEDTVCIEPMPYAFVKQIIDNAPTVIVDNYSMGYQDGVRKVLSERPKGECKTCRHRDPEDKKCDCGGLERQGCPFPVNDDYYCKFYEKGGAE